MAKKTTTNVLPILPIEEIAPLPGLIVPLRVSDKKGLRAISFAREEKCNVVLLLRSLSGESNPTKALARIGGRANILQEVVQSSGEVQLRLHVTGRVRVSSFTSTASMLKARVMDISEPTRVVLSEEDELLLSSINKRVRDLKEYEPSIEEHLELLEDLSLPGEVADFVVSLIPVSPVEAQRVVEELDGRERLKLALEIVNAHIDVSAIRERIAKEAELQLSTETHQELLREQIRLIRAELGEGDDFEHEIRDLKKHLQEMCMPETARKEAEGQLRRLQQLHPDTSEAALARTYLDWIVDLPWSKKTKDRLDLDLAAKILDEDHFGLEKSKERILDFLAVRKLKPEGKGSILLFVGPPGVGKTSLGRSIARALDRKFVRISLGGLRDEAELRGHRRTYVGALPGRIIQGLKSAGTRNPVFMLDELDKIGSDFRGDPASVLLEVLDPEQNNAFEDHYLNIPFDLSEVLFIGTANITDTIPPALLDRMEVIEISGYTPREKLHIAKRYLVPQELDAAGLGSVDVKLGDQTIFHIMNGYTRESGVRQLRRSVGAVLRKISRAVATGGKAPHFVSPKMAQKFLGPVLFVPERRLRIDEVGVVAGLAWTEVGGEILLVEVAITKGKGQLSLTGQLGDVMRESAMAALTYVLSRAVELGIDAGFYESSQVHLHVPQGAIPKDGPSAGIAIATALVSVLTGRPVRKNVAMTGEITLRGNVLPIGGLKEKALAALRAGMDTVIIPKENERELVEFPRYLREEIRFVSVEAIDEVFALAMLPKTDSPTVEHKTLVRKPRMRGPKTSRRANT